MNVQFIYGLIIGDEIMKILTTLTSIIPIACAMVLSTSVAVAAPNGPAGKASVLHCGCNLAGDGMEYTVISINSKSRGHDAHVAGTIDSCFDGVEIYTDIVRTGADCQIDGPELGDPIALCDENSPSAGDVCGTVVIQ
jgi:hypothetical protein